ncbi:MAG: N-methyl-L-tryptophan oxidase [Caldilineaceae bacterium]
MNQSYDVIIVGLGAMGSAAVYQLARRGVRVLGIDQYDPPHTLGSTHGETRITRQANGEGAAYTPLALRSYELWREVEAITKQELLTITGGLIVEDPGGAHFHGQSSFVERTAKVAREYDIAHEVLDAAGIRAHSPMLKLQGNEMGYYEPNGGLLRPERIVQTQIALGRALGAEIHTNERVMHVDVASPGQAVVVTDQGRYAAAKVVLAAGPWIGDLLGNAFQQTFSVYRQVIYWFEAAEIERFQQGHFPFLIWIASRQEDFFSVFPVLSDSMRAVKVLTEEYVETTSPATVNRQVAPAEVAYMYDHFIAQRMAGLQNSCVQSGVCLYTNTTDEHFVIDFHPQHPEIIVASPCSGHGFKHSAAIGEVIAQLATDGESRFDLRQFRFGRTVEE